MKIGQRVELAHLMAANNLFGNVIDFIEMPKVFCGINTIGIATVKLDCQEQPISSVLCYEQKPNGEIPAAYWQICWPITLPT